MKMLMQKILKGIYPPIPSGYSQVQHPQPATFEPVLNSVANAALMPSSFLKNACLFDPLSHVAVNVFFLRKVDRQLFLREARGQGGVQFKKFPARHKGQVIFSILGHFSWCLPKAHPNPSPALPKMPWARLRCGPPGGGGGRAAIKFSQPGKPKKIQPKAPKFLEKWSESRRAKNDIFEHFFWFISFCVEFFPKKFSTQLDFLPVFGYQPGPAWPLTPPNKAPPQVSPCTYFQQETNTSLQE